MARNRKLQVFVSSTYTDLRQERQAAVEAILTAGHIPAGMELFAAEDQSQMDVIKRWIDESDVYLLILGGRYGSVEPKSAKSYIQLEYEYAIAQDKPFFALVIGDECLNHKIKQQGKTVIEVDHPDKYKDFKEQVLTRMIRFWENNRDIQYFVLHTMADFENRSDLRGWVPGNEAVDPGPLAEQIARLTKENAELREQVRNLTAASAVYNGLTFDEMYALLATTKANISTLPDDELQDLEEVADAFGDPEPGLLHAFWVLSEGFRRGGYIDRAEEQNVLLASKLENVGLIERDDSQSGSSYSAYKLSESGKKFLLRLQLERDTARAEQYQHRIARRE